MDQNTHYEGVWGVASQTHVQAQTEGVSFPQPAQPG